MWFRAVFYLIIYVSALMLSGGRRAGVYRHTVELPGLFASIGNIIKRRNRRINALKQASMYVKPYEDIFGNLYLSNKYCAVSLNHKKKTILCTSKVYNENGRMMVLGAKDFSPVDIDEYWDMLCEIFSWHTKYSEIYKSLSAIAIISESVLRIRPEETKPVQQKQEEKECEYDVVEVNVKNRSVLDIPDKPVDVNNCSEAELTALPGISIIVSKKIIKFREEERPFKSVDDFLNVMNIKPRHAKQLKTMLCANKVNMRKVKRAKQERIIDL